MLDRLDRWLDLWARALLALAVLAGIAMMVHVTAEVFMRTVMNAPLRGTSQMVAGYYMIAAAFLPIALLGRRDEHISADVFTDYMRPGLRRWFEAFGVVLGMIYMVLFTWQGWVSAGRRTAQNEVLEIPGGYLVVWPGRWLIPIAGASLFLCFAVRLIRIVFTRKE